MDEQKIVKAKRKERKEMAERTEKCIEGEIGRRKDWRRRSNKRERRRRTEDGEEL